jgi:hypothetical protein
MALGDPLIQCLIGENPPTSEDCDTLAEEIRLSTCLACSYGSHHPVLHLSNHSWVFGNELCQIITTGAGPDDGYPSLLSSYRSELGCILTVLYIVYRICHFYDIDTGKVTIYCDNKGAIHNSFKPQPSGISPVLVANSDILSLAREFIKIIPVTLLGEWVKGHYKSKGQSLQARIE